MAFLSRLFSLLTGGPRPKPPTPEPQRVRISLAPRFSSRRSRGFTLIELLIVVAIVAILAAIAIPSMLAARLNSNETAAIATLRTIIAAQAQFQSTAKADENNNGVGEHGTFAEMAGAVAVRGTGELLRPTVLSTAFGNVSGGTVAKSGYNFAVYLPGNLGVGVEEEATGGAGVTVDADLAESVWCVYAWPNVYGQTGNRTFFVNQGGDVTATDLATYTGPNGPNSNAAFDYENGANLGDTITGNVAVGVTGRDGNFWRSVG